MKRSTLFVRLLFLFALSTALLLAQPNPRPCVGGMTTNCQPTTDSNGNLTVSATLSAGTTAINPTTGLVSSPGLSSVTLRPPNRTDDTTQGYVAGNFWYAPSGLWTAQSVTSGAAVWQPLPRTISPLASTVATPALAYGVCLVVSGYAGNAFEVTRASDSTTQAVGFVTSPNGMKCADWATVDAFCAGTTCGVDTWYDQSGNTKNLTQATQANMPSIVGNSVNGFRSITFDGATTAKSMANAASSIARAGFSAFVVGREAQSIYNNSGNALYEFGGGDFTVFASGNSGVYNAVVHQPNSLNTNLLWDSTPALIGTISGGSNVTLYSNAYSASVTAASAKTMTAVTLGNTALAGGYQGSFEALAFIVWNSALSGANLTTLKQTAYQEYGIQEQVSGTLMGIGDSITAGTGSTANQMWMSQFLPLLNHPRREINAGIGGITAATVSGQMSQYTGNLPTGVSNVAVVAIGTNDIQASTSAATIEGYLTTICAALHAVGAKVILTSVIARSGFSGAQETVRETLNTWELNNWPSIADGFANVGYDPILGCSNTTSSCASNGTYFADGTHPTNLGYSYYAAIVAAAVNALN